MAAEVHRRIAEVLAKARSTSDQVTAVCALGQELAAKDLDGALECFDRALRIDQRHAAAWVGRATILARKNRAGEALNCIERALDREPHSASALLLKAEVLTKVGSRKEALDCVEQVLAKAPNNEDVLVSRAYLLAEMGRDDSDAIADIDRALAVKERGTTWSTRGDMLTKTGRLSDAAKSYRRAVELEPEDVDAWYRLGMSRRKAQDFDGARQALRRFVELAPNGDARIETANALLEPEDRRVIFSKDAETIAPLASEVPPELEPGSGLTIAPPLDGPPLVEVARGLHKEGKDIEALRLVERALRESDEDLAIWLLRAEVLLTLGKAEPAAQSAVLAARRDPTNAEAWKLTARCYLETKKYDRALDAAERAYGLLPNDALVHRVRGDCLVGLNRHLEAVYAYEKSVHFGPARASGWLALGRVLRLLERVPAARVALEKAHSIAEENGDAKAQAEAEALIERL